MSIMKEQLERLLDAAQEERAYYEKQISYLVEMMQAIHTVETFAAARGMLDEPAPQPMCVQCGHGDRAHGHVDGKRPCCEDGCACPDFVMLGDRARGLDPVHPAHTVVGSL